MKSFNFKLLLVLIYLIPINTSYSIESPKIKNLIIYKEPKKLENIEFMNSFEENINIKEFRGKIVILNFWATWCVPCRDEMPSLDKLVEEKSLNNLQIFPINIGKEPLEKSQSFFNEIKIENLQVYYDNFQYIPKKLLLRGIPTTILINKDGYEFARIVGAIDFNNEDFISWLKNFN